MDIEGALEFRRSVIEDGLQVIRQFAPPDMVAAEEELMHSPYMVGFGIGMMTVAEPELLGDHSDRGPEFVEGFTDGARAAKTVDMCVSMASHTGCPHMMELAMKAACENAHARALEILGR